MIHDSVTINSKGLGMEVLDLLKGVDDVDLSQGIHRREGLLPLKLNHGQEDVVHETDTHIIEYHIIWV